MISSTSSATSISQLFAKLDTKNQGYLEKSDLASIFSQISGASDSSSTDNVFAALDTDSDGKVTESEFSSTLSKLQDELDSQYNQMRMGNMPPPPPPSQTEDTGFTKDELSKQLEEIGNTDSQRSSLISNIVGNFEAADTDGNGKVTFAEAQAYDPSSSSSATTSVASAGESSNDSLSDSNSSSKTDGQVMMMIMQLMHAYADNTGTQISSNSLSISA